MKRDNSGTKKNKWVSVVLIIAEIAVIVALAIILINQKLQNDKKSDKKQSESVEQYEQNQQLKTESTLYNYLRINEINAEGDIEIVSIAKYTATLKECKATLNGEEIATFEGQIKPSTVMVSNTGKTFKKGDVITLLSNGTIADSIIVPEFPEGKSYGRGTTNTAALFFLDPTVGNPNDEKTKVVLDTPYFSAQSGFYKEAFDLYIVSDEEHGKVYYTLDGTEPDENSIAYDSQIRISNVSGKDNVYSAVEDTSIYDNIPSSDVDKCVCVRAVYIDNDGNRSEEIDGNYFVGYENKAAYRNMPILAIISNPEGLFDYFDGAYVLGEAFENQIARTGESNSVDAAGYFSGKKLSGAFQFFGTDKVLETSGKANISVRKDGSVHFSQKSLYMEVSDADSLKTSRLGDFLHEPTNTMLLDASSVDTLYKYRDQLVKSSMEGSNALFRDMNYVSVFLDGEYWGVYVMTDVCDTAFIEDEYGLKASDVALVDTSDVNRIINYNNAVAAETARAAAAKTKPAAVTGKPTGDAALYMDFYNYVTQNDMSDDKKFARVRDELDIKNYIENYTMHLYIADYDYPNDESYIFKSKTKGTDSYNDGKWRIVFGNADNSVRIAKTSNFSLNTFLAPQIEGDALLNSLLDNREFRNEFLETLYSMSTNWFDKEKVNEWMDEYKTQYGKAIIHSNARFGETLSDVSINYQKDMAGKFFTERAKYILGYAKRLCDRHGGSDFVIPIEVVEPTSEGEAE